MSFKDDLVALQPYLHRFTQSMVGRDRAEDITQTTLERALLRRHQYTTGTNLKAWLFAIAQHVIISEYRQKKTRAKASERLPLSPHWLVQPATQDAHMCLLEIRKCVEARGDPDWDRLLPLLEEGYTCDEIAQMEGVPRGTIKSRAGRLRAHVRTCLDIDDQVQFLNELLFR